jgi:hypothetical protein
MLSIYVAAAVVGVILILLSTLGGLFEGHGLDLNHSHDLSPDGQVPSVDSHHTAGPDLSSVPFFSPRFWTYFLAGFGCIGIALHFISHIDGGTAIAIAVATGVVIGLAVHTVMRFAQKSGSGEVPSLQEIVGAQATMIVGTSGNQPGKARIKLRGELIDFLALSDDGNPVAAGRKVLIVSLSNNTVKVQDITEILDNELK